MTNEQILKKAIEKAIKNGWNGFDTVIDVKKFTKEIWITAIDYLLKEYSVSDIIFSHDFAEAIWGDKEIIQYFDNQKEELISGENYPGGNVYWWIIPAWQYYLQKMVLEKEPLKYLEKFL